MPCHTTGLNAPPPRNIKYYFAWHLTNGIPFPFMWAEDDGLPVGGIPKYVGEKVEISPEEWAKGDTAPLVKEFPFPKKEEDIPTTTPEDYYGG